MIHIGLVARRDGELRFVFRYEQIPAGKLIGTHFEDKLRFANVVAADIKQQLIAGLL